MRFFIPCDPPKATHQASLRIIKKKDGTQFVGKYAKSKGKKAQVYLSTLLAPYAPKTPLDGPLMISVEWTYPWNKSETKRRKACGWLPCDKKPDADNLCKSLFDVMTRLGFWVDDGRLASVKFVKGWGDVPGIEIHVCEWKSEIKNGELI